MTLRTHTSSTLHRLFMAMVWLCALCGMSAVFAAPPAAGTLIKNTATATFVDAKTGFSATILSNTVQVTVAPLEGCTLSAGQSITRAPGATFYLPHTLTNTGNTSESCLLTATVPSSAGYTPTKIEVVEDLNGNGVADPGEPVIAAGSGITLAAGATVNVLIVGTVPSTVTPGQTAAIVLTATGSTQSSQTATSTDNVATTSGAALTVTKSASTTKPTAGSQLTYTLSVTNQGNIAATGINVSVDGAAQTLVLLRDAIPANTTFQNLATVTNATRLFHRLGDATTTYVSTLPSGVAVDAIAWGVPTLAAGATLTGQFTVTVDANAAGTLTNIGYTDYATNGATVTTPSNEVQLSLPSTAATIDFYSSGGYSQPEIESSLTAPLYLQINAAACNSDATTAQTYQLRLTTAVSKDQETYTATETSPNSGLFRVEPDVPTADARTHAVVVGDGTLELQPNDVVTATLIGCAAVGNLSTQIVVDPLNIVYDSKTNLPVTGATVTLLDSSGAPAKVYEADGVTLSTNVVTTGVDGSFSFDVVAPGTYSFKVTPPTGYSFPSKILQAQQPAGRVVSTPGSYGGSFTVSVKGPVRLDIPLDASATGGLIVEKTASQASAEVGDFVDYTIIVTNHSGVALTNVQLNDWLPAGFEYSHGSARLQSRPVAEPKLSGGMMAFAIGSLINNASETFTYRVAIAPGAQSGNGINSAQAQSGTLRSNLAQAKVDLVGGVFTNNAILIGKVFADCNGNKIQDNDEPGIPGVRVWLADGTYAITDGDGKYSLYGLTPRTTVAAVDPSTLPDGATLEVLNHRNAHDPSSAFVDLQNGELHKTDFAINECSASMRAQIAARRKALNQPEEALALAQNLLTTQQTTTTVTDDRALPASGTLGLTGITADGTSVLAPNVMQSSSITPLGAIGDMGGSIAQQSPAARPLFPQMQVPSSTSDQPSAKVAAEASATQESLAVKPVAYQSFNDSLPHLDASVGFIGLQDNQIMPTDQTRVQVKGPAGATLQLTVNGVAIPATQIGTRASLESHHVSGWEYIGVKLQPGDNKVEVSALDSFGNARGHASINLRAPGALAALRIVLPTKAIADAQTPALITVQPVDANGLPITTRLPVTLVSSQGVWQVKDLNASEPGTQVFIEGGAGVFPLLSPANPGTALITVSSGNIEANTKLTFSPNLRPMFGVGIVEGVLNLSKLDPRAIQPTQSTDAFETEITSVSNSFDDGKASAAARSEVFLKGKVLGSTLLTLGYDSNKPNDTQLFRDIQPDQYYPVYGDSSVKGFDAQSTGKLYVRLDHGTSFLLLGDYTTQSDNPARQLTQYSRALNGLKGREQTGPITVDAFAAHTSSTQVVTEIQGNGTSGPYQLSLDGVINSQQVDLITRDRTQPGVVLSDKPLTPFVDYTIENYTGRLLFMAPVAAVDANLNPVFIRVTYEEDLGGPKHMVGGLDATYQVTKGLAVGATAIRDDDPTDRQDLDGINLTTHIGAKSTLVGEVAQSNTTEYGRGDAERLEWRAQGTQIQGRLWGIHTDSAFYNPSALQSAGQSQYGMQLGYTIDPKDRIVLEGLRSVTPLAGGTQNGESMSLQHSLPGNMKLSVGIRHASGEAQNTTVDTTGSLPASTQVDFTSAFARLDAPVPYVPKANVFTQYEHALNEDAQVGTIGGTYALGNAGKLYLTHETSNSLSGAYGLNPNVNQYSTVFGFQTAMANQTQLFNEYRIGDSIDGRSAEDAVGLRHMFQIEPGLGVSASAERIHPVDGQVSDESEALTTAVSYTASDVWKGSGRLEWRESQTSQSWLATGAVATKVDENWTLLNRGLYSSTDNRTAQTDGEDVTTESAATDIGAGSQHLAQVQSGFAYRPTGNDVWNALGMVGYKRDQDSTLPVGEQLDEREWIVLTQVNVQPSATWDVSARYAAKYAVDLANGITSVGWTQLIGGRAIKDISDNWDLGAQAYTSWGVGTRRFAVGAELGYLVRRNLWVSVGYNVLGFSDPDLAGGSYTQQGIYLRLRFKFGADLFEQIGDLRAAPTNRTNAAAALMSGAQTVGSTP